MKDLYRLERALFQAATTGEEKARVKQAAEAALSLSLMAGPFSKSRQALLRIGKVLIKSETPEVLIPVCMPYGSLDGAVPEMAVRHLSFLKECRAHAKLRGLFLLPLQEADDEELLRANNLTREEFAARIRLSGERLSTLLQEVDARVVGMDEAVQGLEEEEASARSWIASEPSFKIRLQNETIDRSALYDRTMRGASYEARVERTIRTAAQYVALGRYAATSGRLVMNHTTTNLAWYGKTEAGVLHNPVSMVE